MGRAGRPRGRPLPAVRAALAAFALALALNGACGGGGCGPAPPGGRPARVPPAAGTEALSSGTGLAAERTRTAAPRSSSLLEGTVVRVRDGDSIVVATGGAGVEVRLIGIDCPELGQAYGRRARSRTTDLALGRTVRVDGKGKDGYGRELAEVFLPDGRSLNRELVAAGCAWWFRGRSDDRGLERLEREARAARRGLWADPNPVAPWEFRAAGRR